MYTFNTSFLLLTLSVALSGVQSHVTRHRHRTSPPVCHEDKELRALERFPDFADEFCPEFLAQTGKYPLWLDHWDKKKVSSACSCYEKTATSSGAPSTIPATGTLSLSSSAPAAVSSVFATTTASSGFFPTASASGGLFPTASASGGYFPSGYTSGGYYPSGSVFASGSSMLSVPNRGVSPLTSCTTSALVSTSAPTIAASSSPSLSISNGSSTVASSTTPSGTSSLPPGDNYPPQPPGEGPGKRGLVYNSLTQNGWSALFNDSKYATYGSNGGWDRGTQLDESFHFVPTLVVDSDLNNAEWNTAVPVLIEGGTKAIFA